jgi:hypothetical protein
MRGPLAIAWLALALQGPAARAQEPGWSVEGFLGGAWNLPTRLTIRQDGQPDIVATARYSTHGLRLPVYYAARAGRWGPGSGWELELLHHKLYLDEPPALVQHFEVTHGFNLVSVLRGWREGAIRLRAGCGAVVAHAESEVRGARLRHGGNLPGGYHLAGLAVQAAGGRRFGSARGPFAVVEVKLTAALARVPVASGSASVPNLAVHLLVGAGWTGAP